MIRRATDDDIPRISQIRLAVSENQLSDPSRVILDEVRWFIAQPGIFVWEQDEIIVGFSAADPRDGSISALFMDAAFERRGIGRALFERACAVLQAAGHKRMWLTTGIGARAERFYRAAGWRIAETKGGQYVMEKRCIP